MPPWEKYQNTSTAESGPWAKYAAPPAETPDTSGTDLADVPGGGGAQPQPGAVEASREAWRTVPATTAGVASAATEGYRGSPDIVPQSAIQQAERAGPVGYYLTSPLLQLVNQPLKVAGGLYRGGQEAVNELLSPLIGSQGARDIVSIPDAFAGSPGQFHGQVRIPRPDEVAPAVRAPLPDRAPPGLSRVEQLQQAADAHTARLREGMPEPPTPAPETPAAAPQPAGAQITPNYEAIHTPKEEAAYRSTAEGSKLLEQQIIGERDNNAYIPGVSPNTAELEQTVHASRDMKQLGIASPEASQLAKEAQQQNNIARREYSLNTEKTPVDIANREAVRQADIERQSKAVFDPANTSGEVSLQPVIEQMQAELNTPRNRENTPLQTEFGNLIKRLTNEDGSARTMSPEQAWGLRQDIDRLTDKRAQLGDDPQSRNLRHVAGNLSRVADNLDGLIEAHAPGYGEMLRTYKEHSNAIREMEVLQGLTSKLSTGPNGSLSYSAMQRFMKNVVDSRSTHAMDLNAYKSLSPETMQRLWNLRDDLRRSAGAQELARAAGSDTAQNILDVMRRWGASAGQGAAHAGAAAMFGPVGPVALRMAQEATAPYMAARKARRDVSRMQQMLSPNDLLRTPPGQENP